MPNVLRATWKANRHWLAAGFLISTLLFLLFFYFSMRDTFHGVAENKATYLTALANSPVSLFVPGFRRAALQEVSEMPRASALAMTYLPVNEQDSSPDRLVVRNGTMNIVAVDPARAAEQVRALAERMSGFVVNSTVSGDEQSRTAQVALRVPTARFDEAREQVRHLAKSVEQDSTQSQDVTREAVEQDATLRNDRAEETQYLAILRRSGTVKDVLAVSEKLAEVRGRIEREDAGLGYLRHQVAMSMLTVAIRTVEEKAAPGVHWKPLVAGRLSLIDALDALGQFADSVVALLLYLPVIAAWVLLGFVILKLGWWTLVRLGHLFFPTLALWRRHTEQAQAT
jgi:hypothetical protein